VTVAKAGRLLRVTAVGPQRLISKIPQRLCQAWKQDSECGREGYVKQHCAEECANTGATSPSSQKKAAAAVRVGPKRVAFPSFFSEEEDHKAGPSGDSNKKRKGN